MTTITRNDFLRSGTARKVAPLLKEVCMPKIHVMSVIGSAVPAPLRADGLLACWYVVSDGVALSGPFTSRAAAQIKATSDTDRTAPHSTRH